MKRASTLMLIIFTFSLQAQLLAEKVNENVKQKYSGSLSLTEVISDILDHKNEELKERTISVTIPLIKESKLVSKNIERLPLDISNEELNKSKRTATLSIPFKASDFQSQNKGSSDYDFAAHIEDVASDYQVLNFSGSNNKDMISDPNCAGLPVGSTIVDKQDMGCLGTVTNTYTCQADPVNGGNNWYLTKSIHEAATHCVLGPE